MISDLNKITFHDLPVVSLELNFANREVIFIVKEHDEGINDYFQIKMIFSGSKNFSIENMEDLHINEITDCHFEKRDLFHFIEFTMLYSDPCIPITMSFLFNDVEVAVESGFEMH